MEPSRRISRTSSFHGFVEFEKTEGAGEEQKLCGWRQLTSLRWIKLDRNRHLGSPTLSDFLLIPTGTQSFELAMRTDLSAASTKPGTACDSAL